jgi:hypothetical protein
MDQGKHPNALRAKVVEKEEEEEETDINHRKPPMRRVGKGKVVPVLCFKLSTTP